MTSQLTTLDDAVELLSQGVDKQHYGAQLYVSFLGQTLADTSVGQARPGVEMTPGTLTPWACATKPILAVAVMQCWDSGLLDLADPLAAHVPSLAGIDSLDNVTIKDALAHTMPIPSEEDPLYDVQFATLPDAVEKIAAGLPRQVPRRPGTDAHYASWGYAVLAWIVENLTGQPFLEYARSKVLLPLGMKDTWIGVPVDVQASYQDRIGGLYDFRRQPVVELDFSLPQNLALLLPPFGGVGPVSDLGRLYEWLMKPATVPGVLSPQALVAMTARHRVGLSEFNGNPVDFGLGVELESRHYGLIATSFGYHTSLRTFGHKGECCLIAFADPVHDLVIACHVNGIIEGRQHGARVWSVVDAVYRKLGLEQPADQPH
jgi:CubicO group peptidase (beta-lactamase class C family)